MKDNLLNFIKNINFKATSFYVALFVFIAIVCTTYSLVDYDLFARLIQGKAFFDMGMIMKQDIFSYTPVHTWYDHEWGASVIFYWVYKYFGATGLIVLKVILVFSIFAILIQTLKMKGVKYTTPYNFLFFFFAIHAARYAGFNNTIRCLLFTYLFFAIWLYILERVRIKKENYLLVTFIPMMLFWSNIHGGCLSGLGLLAIYSVGEFLNKKPFKHYIFTILGCLAIMFANPWGFDYVKFLFMAGTMQRITITEWQPTFGNFNAGLYLFFKTYFIVMASIILTRLFQERKNLKSIDFTKFLFVFAMAFLALRFTRHQPFFVIACVVFLYDDFYRIYNSLINKIKHKSEKFNNLKEAAIYSLVFLSAASFFALNKPQIVISNNSYPVKPIEFIKKNNLQGKLAIEFQFGSYAIYKLFPMCLVSMDGRYEEVYPDKLLHLLGNFFTQRSNKPNQFLEYFRPDIIVISHDYNVNKYLKTDNSYSLAYKDELWAVWLDSKLAKKKYLLPSDNINYYNQKLFDTLIRFKRVNPNTINQINSDKNL